MNKIQIIIDSVLALAIIALFIVVFAIKPHTTSVAPSAPVSTTEVLPVAYLNIDSLLIHYTFAVEANDKLINKQEDAKLKLNTKARTLQSEMAEFQRKYDNNAFLSAERAQSEYQRLQKKQQDLQELEQKLTQEIMVENQSLNMQLSDSLSAFLSTFNADGRYHIIFSNTNKDNVLMSNVEYDITDQVIEGLNKRYKK